jgi:drug/metabolite transporter (DMT)-like permease
MIYLISALFFSLSIIVSFKLFPKYKISITQAITTNYLTAATFGFFTLQKNINIEFFTDNEWSLTAFISGVFLILVFNIFALSAEKTGVAITAVSSKMSVIIPVLLGTLIFGESFGILKILGLVLVLISFWLIFKKKGGYQIKTALIILPVLLFLGNGTNDSILKFAQFHYITSGHGYVHYLTVAFSISLILGTLVLIVRFFMNKEQFKFKNILAGVLLGTLNWYSTLFFLKGLGEMDVSVFIPVFNAGLVSTAAIVGLFVFKEPMSKLNIFGILLSIIAITIIAYAN